MDGSVHDAINDKPVFGEIARAWLKNLDGMYKRETMKAYGYKLNSDKHLELKETCLVCSLEEIDAIIDMLQKHKKNVLKLQSDSKYQSVFCDNQTNMHLQFCYEKWDPDGADLIIMSYLKNV